MTLKSSVKRVTIHTDGGCAGNPGPGGWAAVLRFGEHHFGSLTILNVCHAFGPGAELV